MRPLKIIAVGKIKQSAQYLKAGIDLYATRLKRDFAITWIELPEGTLSATKTVQQIVDTEAEAILKHCDSGAEVLLLNERGRSMTSETLSARLFSGNPPNGGRRPMSLTPMIFIIGGAYGTSPKLQERASEVISLSPLTFPHQMVRLLLMEQLYRAATIARGEPYHK